MEKKVKCVSAKYWEDLTVGKIYKVLDCSDFCYKVEDDLGYGTWSDALVFEEVKDTVVDSVVEQFKQRSNVGIEKYGVTMDREDLSPLQWLQHLQEELMDATLYVEKLKSKL